jgi:ATP-dependent helicase YprA (DUF1998 family)
VSHVLEEPLESVLDTVGVWFDIPAELEADREALHAFEHAVVNALPLVVLCDRRDVGSLSALNRVYVYDFAEGGIGLADKAYHLTETLLDRARSLLRGCPCSEGCPNCMHLAGCADANAHLDKVGGLALLEGRGVGAARAADRLLRPPARPSASRSFTERRSRLREIAEADLRERYGGAPVPINEGDLAMASGTGLGLVVVRAIEGDRAEVQALGTGEVKRVALSALRPI